MLRRFSITFALFSMVLDMLSVVAGMRLAAMLRPGLSGWWIVKPLSTVEPLWPVVLYVVFPAIAVFIFSAFALYDGKKYLRAVDEFATLSLSFVIVSISLAGVLYFTYRDISRALFVLAIVLAYFVLLIWRAAARIYFRWRKEWEEQGARRFIIVGAGSLGKKVHDQISRHTLENLRFVGFVDDNPPSSLDGAPSLLGGSEAVAEIVRTHGITDVVIALPHSDYSRLGRIVSLLEDVPVRIWVALGFFDLALYEMNMTEVAGIPMLDLRAPALSEVQLQVKRAFDLVFGSLALVVTLPVMAVCALLIWLEDRGPVLFTQMRVGENGRLFKMYKFRTMCPDAESLRTLVERTDSNGNLIHKSPNDPRVTRVGRFLRRTSLDELPQLFNALNGSMSLVGPRPELPYLVEKYQPWQRKRFAVPPGITGWWQVNGRSDRPMHLNTEDDLYYIQNYSLALDIVILMRTVWIVIIGRGSY